ncbi:MAG: ribonuclease H family protein [Syntrophomonas sp.]
MNIFCDGSYRTVKRKGKPSIRVAFSAWVNDQGKCWCDKVYAQSSTDAEIAAVLHALYWASQQKCGEINIYTDDESIVTLADQSRTKRGIKDIVRIRAESEVSVSIIKIPRKQNIVAHKLCEKAYNKYIEGITSPKKTKINRAYYSIEAIERAISKGLINAVYSQTSV